MTIRQRFLALAATILGIGFFGASSAQATPHYTPSAPCIDWNVSSTTWPTANAGDTHFFICDGSYQNHANPSAIAISGVRNAAQNQSAVVRNKLLTNNVDVFVFKTPADYNSYVGLLAPQAASNLLGFTTTSMQPLGPHTGYSIAIFEDCTNPPTGCVTADYTTASRTVNHEVGHAVDFLMGQPSLMTGTGKFKTQFDLDKAAFNALSPSTINWSGLPGTCTGTNFEKLKCWIKVTEADGSDQFYREFFAHCYSAAQPSSGYPVVPVNRLYQYFSTGGMAPSSTVRSCTIANNTAQTP